MQQIQIRSSIISQSWVDVREMKRYINEERNFHFLEKRCVIAKAILRNCLINTIVFYLFRTLSKILDYSRASQTDVLSEPPQPGKKKK